ncbi:MAG TPA: rod shape-determining protein MreD [Streptosporangiaceae bacterium]|nr:rod shape-determining protein MreD [Streptosporangiaceae bacterium]
MRRAARSGGLLLLAIVIQLTVLNNLRLPGGAGPDLVLVVVVAVALTGGPLEGLLGGFCAGLALDVAPPATHLMGQYALVFCIVGYAAGRLGADLDSSAWVPIGAVAVGSAAGELLYALTGMIFGDADITWTAVRQVLPASVVYDVLLSPFVLYAVARARGQATQRLAAFRGGSASQPLVATGLAAAAGLLSASGAVVRDTGTGRAPRLKSRAMRGGAAQAGSAGGTRVTKRPPAQPVHLRLGGGRAMRGGSASGTRIAQRLPVRPVHLRLGSRDWASRYRGGAVTGSSRRTMPGSAFGRSGGTLGDGAGGRALRPSRGPRLRGSVMQGGSASGARTPAGRPVRPVHLRLGAARRRDGAIGGPVLGRRGSRSRGGGSPGRGGGLGRGAFGGGARRRPATGKTHTPRFRRSKPGTVGGRGMAASFGGPGPGGSRFGGAGAGALGGRRGRAVFGRRPGRWRFGSKRTGGL